MPDHPQEISSIDNDVKGKYDQYNQCKTNLTALKRKQTSVARRALF
jgi:V-type H+-transporting ATPase subunit C